VPYCAGVPDGLRHACFALEGNRYEAAKILVQLGTLLDFDCRRDDSAKLNGLFAAHAILTAQGKLAPRKDIEPNPSELRCENPSTFMKVETIEGQENSVLVSGTLRTYEPNSTGAPNEFVAPYRQVWTRAAGTVIQIVSWDIGERVRVDDK
jgi:hypothetical protein